MSSNTLPVGVLYSSASPHLFYVREPKFKYYHKQMPLILVLTSEPSLVADVVAIFNQTVISCGQKRHPGVFGLTSKFIFFVGKDEKKQLKNIFEIVFGQKHFQDSAYVTIAKEADHGNILFYNYNFNNPKSSTSQYSTYLPSSVTLSFIWKERKPLSDDSKVFTDRSDFQGKRFRVGPLVWSHCVVVSPVTGEYYGWEVEMLKSVGKILNFSYDIILPTRFDGIVLSDDKLGYAGIVADVAYGVSDISMGSAAALAEVFQMVESTVRIDGDVYTLASPKSKPVTKVFAPVRPFQMIVWLGFCGTFAISVSAFVLVSKMEGEDRDVKELKTITSAFLFCYGTVLQESMSLIDKIGNRGLATR